MLSPLDPNPEMVMDINAGPASQSPHGGLIISQKENGPRLRTSCDTCQSLKVKCSQDKPSCRRCSKNGLDCVYSPFRRMGRPKRPSVPAAVTPRSQPQSQSQSYDGQRQRHSTTSSSPASMVHPQPTSHAQDGMQDLFEAGPAFRRENGALTGTDEMFNGAMVLETESNALTSPLSGTMLENSPGMTSVGDDGFNSLSAVGDPSGLTQQQSRLLPSPLTILVGLDSQIGEQERSSATKDGETQQDAGHCYLAILQRLTQLEDTLNTGPQPPRLDVVLTAERDTRTLKERLFACQGHGRQELDISTSPTIPKDRGQEPCIDAHGSSLLVISLLADRVISLLEDLFRRAAVSSHALDQATRGTTASWLLGSPPGFSSQAGERRFERSARSSFSRDIHCPVPEANCELTIGSYEIDAEVKSRVMKRILKQRVSALERMVGDLKNYLMDVTGQDDRSGRERTEPRAGEQGGILLGNVPRSQGLSQAATAHMIEDLHWRVELLQGRLELAGY